MCIFNNDERGHIYNSKGHVTGTDDVTETSTPFRKEMNFCQSIATLQCHMQHRHSSSLNKAAINVVLYERQHKRLRSAGPSPCFCDVSVESGYITLGMQYQCSAPFRSFCPTGEYFAHYGTIISPRLIISAVK